ncbi:MAG: hypothetical protein IT539_01385 [Bradyrhizobiaceae bacterium]|nr:hypothetical protein [Bradyrhizobiaceae bacterium]
MKKESKTKRQPTHVVWQVIGESDKAKWIRVGAGWANKDGKGISLVFDAYPMTGRTVVREVTENEDADATGGQE